MRAQARLTPSFSPAEGGGMGENINFNVLIQNMKSAKKAFNRSLTEVRRRIRNKSNTLRRVLNGNRSPVNRYKKKRTKVVKAETQGSGYESREDRAKIETTAIQKTETT